MAREQDGAAAGGGVSARTAIGGHRPCMVPSMFGESGVDNTRTHLQICQHLCLHCLVAAIDELTNTLLTLLIRILPAVTTMVGTWK